MSLELTQKQISGTVAKPRMNDHGRRAAYDAEGRAFGGFWYEDSCTAPKLTRSDLEEMFDLVVDWCMDNLLSHLPGRKRRPVLVWTKRSNDVCWGDFRSANPRIGMTSVQRNGMRISCLLHEIAHWCVVGGKPHGKVWQAVFVTLVREFMGDHDADRLAAEFSATPVKKRRKRKTFQWSYRAEDGVWMRCKRKDIVFDDTWSETYAKAGHTAEAWLAKDGRTVWVVATEVTPEVMANA